MSDDKRKPMLHERFQPRKPRTLADLDLTPFKNRGPFSMERAREDLRKMEEQKGTSPPTSVPPPLRLAYRPRMTRSPGVQLQSASTS